MNSSILPGLSSAALTPNSLFKGQHPNHPTHQLDLVNKNTLDAHRAVSNKEFLAKLDQKQKREKGRHHHAILRSLADKWQRTCAAVALAKAHPLSLLAEQRTLRRKTLPPSPAKTLQPAPTNHRPNQNNPPKTQ